MIKLGAGVCHIDVGWCQAEQFGFPHTRSNRHDSPVSQPGWSNMAGSAGELWAGVVECFFDIKTGVNASREEDVITFSHKSVDS